MPDASGLDAQAWEAAQQARDFISRLSRDYLTWACDYAGLPRALAKAVQDAAQAARGQPIAQALFRYCRHLFASGRRPPDLPRLNGILNDQAALFPLLVVLSELQTGARVHQQHAVPAEVVAASLGDLTEFPQQHLSHAGHWGLDPLYAYGWLRNHVTGRLYRLGRLQFILGHRWPRLPAVFRHRGTGEIVAMATEQARCRGDGLLDGAAGVTDPDAWTPRLDVNERPIEGHRIDRQTGRVAAAATRLDPARWQRVEPRACLDLHIPAGEPLTAPSCRDSFAQAVAFARRHFPEDPADAIVCTTWLLDPQLAQYLGPESNIVQFQRLFHLYPAGCDAWSMFRFIFDMELTLPYGQEAPPDLTVLPRKTRLQRAAIEHVERGGRWYKFGGFILTDGA